MKKPLSREARSTKPKALPLYNRREAAFTGTMRISTAAKSGVVRVTHARRGQGRERAQVRENPQAAPKRVGGWGMRSERSERSGSERSERPASERSERVRRAAARRQRAERAMGRRREEAKSGDGTRFARSGTERSDRAAAAGSPGAASEARCDRAGSRREERA